MMSPATSGRHLSKFEKKRSKMKPSTALCRILVELHLPTPPVGGLLVCFCSFFRRSLERSERGEYPKNDFYLKQLNFVRASRLSFSTVVPDMTSTATSGRL